jgi:choline-sulfatase
MNSHLVLRLVALIVAVAFFSDMALSQTTQPNVVFIIADDLTTALGTYGRPVSTPNIDALAASGMRFDNAYCQYPVCGPSRASIMTGLYPAATGSLTNESSDFRNRFPDITTLPQLFRESGYATARVSKIYHMGIPPDILAGTSGIDDPLSWDTAINIKAPEANAAGPQEDLSPLVTGVGADFIKVESTDGPLAHADGMAAQKAIDWLRQRDTNKPFFLAVGMVRPHVPLVAPTSYFDLYPYADVDLPYVPTGDLNDVPTPAETQTNAVKYGMSVEQQKKTVAAYYASVSYMDAQVGRVLEELNAQGLTDNTIVVFTSDHGYNLGEHTTWQKLSLFEDTMRVPLIVSAPGQTAVGSSSTGIVEMIDVYPTITDLAGLTAPNYLHGNSFADLLTDPTKASWQSESAYAVTFNGGESLRTRQWRYNLWANGEQELYDQVNDSGEFTNLASDPAYANILAELNGRLNQKRSESLSFDINAGLGDLDGNGIVDVLDWHLFRPNLLRDVSTLLPDIAFSMGDFDRSGRIDGRDYAIFKTAYEADNGAGSFAARDTAVPEPNLLTLVAAGITALLCRIHRVRFK